MAQWVKNLPASVGDSGDLGLIPGSRRSPGEGHGNPLQYSCLKNPVDRGAWWAIVERVSELDTAEQEHKMTMESHGILTRHLIPK